MKRLQSLLAITALVFAGAAANATPVFTVTGGASVPETGNDFLWIDSNIAESATLGLSEPGKLEIEYIGKEAGFPYTEFWFGATAYPGGTLVATTNDGTPVIEGQTAATPFPPPDIVRGLAPETVMAAAGIVPFYFRIPGNGDAVVANGAPPGPAGSPNLAFWWPGSTSVAPGNVIYALLDDGGGFNPGEPSDNDHDDMIMRLTVMPIPEPGTAEMLFAGLGLLGLVRRRPGGVNA